MKKLDFFSPYYDFTNFSLKESTIYLYVFECISFKFYVGITNNPILRFKNHLRMKKSSSFTKEFPPQKCILLLDLQTNNKIIAERIENEKTKELIEKYGIENVCGGQIVGNLSNRIRMYEKVQKEKTKIYRKKV